MGEDLTLGVEARDSGIDRTLNAERLKLSPTERLEHGRAFADQVIASSPLPRREAW